MTKLMEKPEDLMGISRKFFYGKEMEDYITDETCHDWCRFKFPEGVKEKIEPDKLYKVCYKFYDAADPADFSCEYIIHYIEEVPQDILDIIQKYREKDRLFQIMNDYLYS